MKKRLLNVILKIALCFFLLVGYFYLNKTIHFAIPCPIKKITGLYCPGCGITRCLFALLEGNIPKAFRANQLVFILLPFLIAYFIYYIYLYIAAKKDTILKKIPTFYYIILLIIVLAYGILRNIEYFSFLRPQ